MRLHALGSAPGHCEVRRVTAHPGDGAKNAPPLHRRGIDREPARGCRNRRIIRFGLQVLLGE